MDSRLTSTDDYKCPSFSWWTKTKNKTILNERLTSVLNNMNITNKLTNNEIGWKNCKDCMVTDNRNILKFYIGFVKAIDPYEPKSRIMLQINSYNDHNCSPMFVGNLYRQITNNLADILELNLKTEQRNLIKEKQNLFMKNRFN